MEYLITLEKYKELEAAIDEFNSHFENDDKTTYPARPISVSLLEGEYGEWSSMLHEDFSKCTLVSFEICVWSIGGSSADALQELLQRHGIPAFTHNFTGNGERTLICGFDFLPLNKTALAMYDINESEIHTLPAEMTFDLPAEMTDEAEIKKELVRLAEREKGFTVADSRVKCVDGNKYLLSQILWKEEEEESADILEIDSPLTYYKSN